MKVIYNRIRSLRILCLIFISILLSTGAFAQNVTNGSFESSDTGIVAGTDVAGWLIQVAAAVNPAPEFSIVDDVVKDGNRALKVSVHGIGTNQWDIQLVADSIPVENGASYRYSIWAKANKADVQANFTVGNYDYSEINAIRPANLTTEWKEYTMDFTIDKAQTVVRAPIHFSIASSTESIIYLDNLQITDVNFGKTPVAIEAESGLVGSGFSVLTNADVTYITAKENFTGQATPDDTIRMATYQVTFPDSGTYQLYARVRVGAGGYNDDSFFASKGFGPKSETDAASWVFVNGLGGAGFTGLTDVVKELGSAGSEVWKWVNISQNYFPGGASDKAFQVGLDNLTQTFQIGSREDGLEFDKFVFGKSDLFYTVKALDNGLAGYAVAPVDTTVYQGPPLASGSPKFLGNVKDWDDKNFANIWNQLTPGNEGKWASVAGSQDTTKWNWSNLDNLYTYAKTNKMIFKDHTLIWGSQQPSWINNLSMDKQLMYIETWMRQVGQRYPDMELIDVVNEAIATHNPPDGQNGRANYKNALGGDGATGYDWVIKSFELARKYMPQETKLLLNDYGIINDDNATTRYLQIINLLLEKGVIDGIGVQCHRFEIQNASTTTLKNNLDRLAATGLPIYISEMDLGDNTGDDTAPYDDNLQLQKYQQIFTIFWQHPSVVGVTLWGSLEGRMWQKTCHLINSDNTWRPALEWMADYIANTPVEIKLVETNKAEIVHKYYEVECAQVGSNWELYADDQASNGYYLTEKTGLGSVSSAPTSDDDIITIPFTVAEADNYTVYARVNCATSSDDAFYSSLDGSSFKIVNAGVTSNWEWKSFGKNKLTAGTHSLKLGFREDGAKIDKICVTNSLFPLSGMGDEADNKCDTSIVENSIELMSNADFQIYPNPTKAVTTIRFNVKSSASVSLKIYDLVGQEIETLIDKNMDSGSYQVTWDAAGRLGSKLSNGTYICKLVTGNSIITKKILLVE